MSRFSDSKLDWFDQSSLFGRFVAHTYLKTLQRWAPPARRSPALPRPFSLADESPAADSFNDQLLQSGENGMVPIGAVETAVSVRSTSDQGSRAQRP
jgi:hypothetical protein